MKKLTGVIENDGFVRTRDGSEFLLPIRGTDEFGYPEVLIDSTEVGGSGSFKRQSIAPFIGMKVEFIINNNLYGYNFKIIK